MSTMAFVSPGQGALNAETAASVQMTDRLSGLLDRAESLTGRRLSPDSDFMDTLLVQPSLYAIEVDLGLQLLERGIEPVAVAGHSLGEFAALAIAGVFSPEDGLDLVVERAQCMSDAILANPGGMTAVILREPSDIVGTVVSGIEGVWIANDNSALQLVISGTSDGVAKAEAELGPQVKRLVPLGVAGPFHTLMMRVANDQFWLELEKIPFDDASLPVLQNRLPSATQNAVDIKLRLSEQMICAVRWRETMQELSRMGVTELVEVGPGQVLKGLVRGLNFKVEGVNKILGLE